MAIDAKFKTSKRSAPHQMRSQRTLDTILSAAADLLGEVGFEGLSTNMICKRAGVTPPALYRYFPNKYAVLKELGERLMERQNAILTDCDLDLSNPSAFQSEIEGFLQATIDVTRDTPSGEWIMRSLHATPVLAEVRLKSHRRVAQYLADRVKSARPELDTAQAYQSMRLGVEMGYALVEMVFDEPELPESDLVVTAASMLTKNLRDITSEGA